MACFADINVSQGSVATYASCGGIVDMHLTATLPGNLPVKIFIKSVKNKRYFNQTAKVKSTLIQRWHVIWVVG